MDTATDTAIAPSEYIVLSLHSEEAVTDRLECIAIADNGCGMSKEQLFEAMKLGSEASYNSDSLGKFGMGLIGILKLKAELKISF